MTGESVITPMHRIRPFERDDYLVRRGDANDCSETISGVDVCSRVAAAARASGWSDRAECRQLANVGDFVGPRLSRSAATATRGDTSRIEGACGPDQS